MPPLASSGLLFGCVSGLIRIGASYSISCSHDGTQICCRHAELLCQEDEQYTGPAAGRHRSLEQNDLLGLHDEERPAAINAALSAAMAPKQVL